MKNFKLFSLLVLIVSLESKAADLGDTPHTLSKGNSPSKISYQPDLNSIDVLENDSFAFSKISQFRTNLKVEDTTSSRSAEDTYLFKKVAPSVVLIITKDKKGYSTGTGTLINNDGTILTNYHVVGNNKQVGVFFKPEKDIQKVQDSDYRLANVIKIDQIADLALIKVNSVPAGRAKVELGDASDIAIGADVRAIGHPEGQNWSYTKGIVSQYRLNFKWLNNAADVIQTQTPINPGNSGGPLLTEKGLVIGVNSFLQKGTEGLNFAVSVDEVKRFIARTGDRLNSSQKNPNNVLATTKKCKAKTIYSGKSKDGTAEILLVDSSCKGVGDMLFTYPIESTKPFTLELDKNADGNADVEFFSFTRTEKWDISYWDTNFDGQYDQVGIHPDGNIKPSRYVTYENFIADLENNSSKNTERQPTVANIKSDFHGFGAVHLDDKGWGFGWAAGFQSKDDAEKASSDFCYKNGAVGQCKLMASGPFKCVAIAESVDWRQAGSGSTQLEAENTAIDICNKRGARCTVRAGKSGCSSW
jgi:V8-like Glu-specific endopeptidase